jgi:hypothetical protein
MIGIGYNHEGPIQPCTAWKKTAKFRRSLELRCSRSLAYCHSFISRFVEFLEMLFIRPVAIGLSVLGT